MVDLGDPIGWVTDSTPSLVRVEVDNASEFEAHKMALRVGQFLLIASGNGLYPDFPDGYGFPCTGRPNVA